MNKIKNQQRGNDFFSFSVLLFLLFSWLVLVFFDSPWFDKHYFNGKPITAGFVIFLYIILLYRVGIRLKLLMLLIVPLSYLGEVIFSEKLQWYIYREERVPLHIPFGHAIVFATGWLLLQKNRIRLFLQRCKIYVVALYILMYLFVWLFLGDTLSLVLGVFFFGVLLYKRFNSFYLLMGFIVLYLEIIGTQSGCWTWRLNISVFKTVNPPLGAMFIYVGGDILLTHLLRRILIYRIKSKQF